MLLSFEDYAGTFSNKQIDINVGFYVVTCRTKCISKLGIYHSIAIYLAAYTQGFSPFATVRLRKMTGSKTLLRGK